MYILNNTGCITCCKDFIRQQIQKCLGVKGKVKKMVFEREKVFLRSCFFYLKERGKEFNI